MLSVSHINVQHRLSGAAPQEELHYTLCLHATITLIIILGYVFLPMQILTEKQCAELFWHQPHIQTCVYPAL